MAFSQNIDSCEVRARKQVIFIKGEKPHKLLLAKAAKTQTAGSRTTCHAAGKNSPPVTKGGKTWILLQRREII